MSQHDEGDKGWRQLILGSAPAICRVDHDKLLVKPLPALVRPRKIGLQQFAVGQDCAKVHLRYLAVKSVASANVFEYLLQFGARYVVQIQGVLLLKNENFFTG